MNRRIVSIQTFEQLIEYKKLDDRPRFIALMKTILPEVQEYLGSRLEAALQNKQLPENKYVLADFVDELYIKAFDHIQEVQHDSKLFVWLMQKADELMEDAIIEEDFDDLFFHKIGDYSKKEWEEIVDTYSTKSYVSDILNQPQSRAANYLYTIDNLLDNEDIEFRQKVENQFTKIEIHQIINFALHKLPNDLQTVFDLRANHSLADDEIMRIKKFSAKDVQLNIEEAKRYIKSVFEQRMANLAK